MLGIVSIPGMMTGQILGGTLPEQAASYQIIISFMIALCGLFAMLTSAVLAVMAVVDEAQRLRMDSLTQYVK